MKFILAILSFCLLTSAMATAPERTKIIKPTFPGTKFPFIVSRIAATDSPIEMNNVCQILGYAQTVDAHSYTLTDIRSLSINVDKNAEDVFYLDRVMDITNQNHGFKQVSTIDCEGYIPFPLKIQTVKYFNETDIQRIVGSTLPVQLLGETSADLMCKKMGYDKSGYGIIVGNTIHPKFNYYMADANLRKFKVREDTNGYANSVFCTKF